MARLIPKISVDDIGVKPERDVARALIGQLPQDCIVYHSYPWLRADRSDRKQSETLHEGEADFVIVDPNGGLLVLEVKGGSVEFDSSSHRWVRIISGGRRREIKDPFEQARNNMYVLRKQILDISFPGRKELPCAYGYAVVFPDCNVQGPPPPGADQAVVLGAADLPYLQRRIPEVLKKWNRQSRPARLSHKDVDGIRKGLSPAFRLLPVLFRQIEEEEERLFRLTEEQFRLLEFLKNHSRVAIEGVAGSGKTLLARAQAEHFAHQGRDTLLVCYNKALAEWMRSTLPEAYQDKITVRNFHALGAEYCRQASIEFFPAKDEEHENFWRDAAPERFLQALDQVPKRFDAVVVDEGQDFYPDWWLPLELINKDGDLGAFYVFYDPAQNLFVEGGLSIPDLGEPFQLPTNCRNTKKIASFCSKVRGVEIHVRSDAPDGRKCEISIASDAAEQERACKDLISRWIDRGHLSPSQVAILGPHPKKHSSLAHLNSIGKTRVTPTLERWEKGQAVLCSSIRAFKGLEADAVIMIDIPEPDTTHHFTCADLYVGCSRAKHLLAILATSAEALSFPASNPQQL